MSRSSPDTVVAVGGSAAFGQDAPEPIYDGSLVPFNTDIGVGLNLLWVVIGAVLVVFMQAGFALVETGFTQKKNAMHVMTTNFAIFGLGFVGFFFVGFPLAFGGFSYAPSSGSTRRSVTRLLGSGNWVFLWQGGWALDRSRQRRARGTGRGVLLLHGRVHGHGGDDPHRRHGRAVEVEQLRRLGPVLRRDLLPAVRGVDVGRRLAGQARQHD